MSSPKYEWIVGQSPPMLDPHSRAKHRLLRAYLERYIEILTANPRHESLRIALIDGFCGGGEYLHSNEIVPGSPLILLQEIAAAQVKLDATRTKPTRLSAEYIFVDSTKENLTYLRHCIAQSPFAPLLDNSIELVHRRFEASLPDVVRKVKARGSSERAISSSINTGTPTYHCVRSAPFLQNLSNPRSFSTSAWTRSSAT